MGLSKKIKAFEEQFFKGLKEFNRGIEREALRSLPTGELSSKAHPNALGSALTNSHITTDFSESQLEFVTPYFLKSEETLARLQEIHSFYYSKEEDEFLWPSSMPCLLDPKKDIPIADYGISNLGRLKNIYRVGLKNRYGDRMQAISGLHYNFSFVEEFWEVLYQVENGQEIIQDFKSKKYFSMMRNFHRLGWVILYFFGASPVLHKSFGGNSSNLEKFDEEGTLYLPYATSLRLSDLGYQNKAQKELEFCFNSLDSYINKIDQALKISNPEWEKIGVKVNGQYRQMSDKILQIENEFYGFIRPKRYNKLKNSRPNKILKEEGVQYLEVRIMDLNPFSSIGITNKQTKFLDIFLLYCALRESPLCSTKEMKIFKVNWGEVAKQGRNKNLTLQKGDEIVSLKNWSLEIYNDLKPIAKLLDSAQETQEHGQILEEFNEAILDSSKTLSGRLITELETSEKSFLEFNLDKAALFKQEFLKNRPSVNQMEFFEKMAQESLEIQKKLETSSEDFDLYLKKFLAT